MNKKPILKLASGIIGLALTLACPSDFALGATSDSEGTTPEIKKIMREFFQDLTELQQFVVTDESFANKKNEKTIKAGLQKLVQLSKKALHEPVLGTEGFRFSRTVLEKHILDTQRIFNSGNKPYARWMLSATTSICMSCHTQMPSTGARSWTFDVTKKFPETLNQAEFYFISRHFDTAAELYQKLLKNYPESGLKSDQIDTALERTLIIFARVKRDPKAAIETFRPLTVNKAFPPAQISKVKLWIQYLEEWQKAPAFDLASASPAQIRTFSQELIKKAQETDISSFDLQTVIYARLSGMLYQILNTRPENEFTAEVLYWLSMCDRFLKHNFFYSLGDLYLKECINRWPSTPVAQKCFDEYKEGTIVSYSGTSGTHLPDDIKKELEDLQKKITGAQVKPIGEPKKAE